MTRRSPARATEPEDNYSRVSTGVMTKGRIDRDASTGAAAALGFTSPLHDCLSPPSSPLSFIPMQRKAVPQLVLDFLGLSLETRTPSPRSQAREAGRPSPHFNRDLLFLLSEMRVPRTICSICLVSSVGDGGFFRGQTPSRFACLPTSSWVSQVEDNGGWIRILCCKIYSVDPSLLSFPFPFFFPFPLELALVSSFY